MHINKINYTAIACVLCLLFSFHHLYSFSQSLNNNRIDGYRGIWFELNQKYDYGDKYSGGLGTYTAHHFPLAIYSEEVNKTFFVYGGTTGEDERHLLCMAGCYDHKKHLVEKPTVVYDKQGVNDPHDNPSLLIDREGYLWIFVSGRSTRRMGFKFRSIKPYSIESFKEITSEEMTYPQPWQIENGMLHLFTKYTGVRELYFETSKDGLMWTEDRKLAGIREKGDSKGGHYQVSQSYGNIVGTFFNRHPNGVVDKRTDLYYLQTRDMGTIWTTADGTIIPVPLEEVENPARVKNYQAEGLNVYICDINFDTQGYPVCLYVTSKGHEPGPDNSPYQWRVTAWNGSSWETSIAGESDHNYDMGSIIIKDDKWRIVAPMLTGPQLWGAGGEIAVFASDDRGKTWNRIRQITCNSDLNHGYVRRVINGRPPFVFFWADGDPHQFSISNLYFGDMEGNVWRLPYNMRKSWEKPVKK